MRHNYLASMPRELAPHSYCHTHTRDYTNSLFNHNGPYLNMIVSPLSVKGHVVLQTSVLGDVTDLNKHCFLKCC